MKFYSFRTRITLILFLIVATVSFSVFYAFNRFYCKKMAENTENNLISAFALLNQTALFANSNHDINGIKKIFSDLEKENKIINSYLIDKNNEIIYQSSPENNYGESPTTSELFDAESNISVKKHNIKQNPFYRAVININQNNNCRSCHASLLKKATYLTYDYVVPNQQRSSIIALKFSLIYTLLMVSSVIGFVIIAHFKFVRKALKNFRETITNINKGDLSVRLNIPRLKELGELGESFNRMVANFSETQEQLKIYHKKELENTQKMASIGEMSARLAHEIRNPITGIANAVEIIAEETQELENKPILEEIKRQANRINEAISNLLKYSRSKKLTLVEADINDMIEKLILFLEKQISDKKITFEMDLQYDLPKLKIVT